ncbi:hypothetical protein [Actinokineospora diospyrosa]|uniref:CHAT domain-containing protein n=1 Tax=Actinokineospora diospyrosa TaxID=103728 RepID=A0ABT1I8N6_9PSEU|nr:hypothetical protein [Actinokineospora diospyrosa]MCP2268993.1 hypothetical protein [Actinokineospora diospyrosa]
MTSSLVTSVTIDHSDRLRSVPDDRYNRERGIHLRFIQVGNRFLVQAWGSAFPEDGGGGYQGTLSLSVDVVRDGIEDLRAVWQRELIDHVDPGVRPTRRPFVDEWDLSAPAEHERADRAALALARAGYTLFCLLFANGDAGLKEIADHLTRALRGGEHVITVESDDVFVPWCMLYVPLSDQDSVWASGYRWRPEGFWGYQHLVEHNFSRWPGFDSRIALPGALARVGLNVDHRVDEEYPPTPYVAPVVDFFTENAVTTVRTSKVALAEAMRDPAFADHIVYFGCHGRVGGTDERAYLVLADDEKIYGTEVLAWLSGMALPSSPVVFVGACQGGQLASVFYPAFGHHLLHHGARCLVGPQIDLPRAFARVYALRLFAAFLVPHTRLGDAVRGLTREFLDRYRNPLGLIFSLYRGIDVHLAPGEGV